jgi:hypothetical protein
MADVNIPGAGGRTGETLLILGILGGAGFLLYRKGFFAQAPAVAAERPELPRATARPPRPPRDLALPAPSQTGGVPPVTPSALSVAQQNLIAAAPPPPGAARAAYGEARIAAMDPTERAALTAAAFPAGSGKGSFNALADSIAASRAKPPAVAANVGATSTPMALPSPFGKVSVAARAATSANVQIAAAKPPALSAPRTLAAPRPAATVMPIANPTVIRPASVKPGILARPLASAKPSALKVGFR